jgi:hypothetical protein
MSQDEGIVIYKAKPERKKAQTTESRHLQQSLDDYKIDVLLCNNAFTTLTTI